jgi:hypothetical protein
MATEIDMTLVADNSQYIAKLKEAQQANQNLYNQTESNTKKQGSLIDSISNKQSSSAGGIINNSNKIEAKTVSMGDKINALKSIWAKILIVGAAFGVVLKLVHQGMLLTSEGADALKVRAAGLKSGLDYLKVSLASLDFENLTTNFFKFIEIGKEYQRTLNNIADSNSALSIRQGELAIKTEQLEKTYRSQNIPLTKRRQALLELLEAQKQFNTESLAVANKGLNNELFVATSQTKLSEDELKDLVKNYDLRVDKMEAQIQAARDNSQMLATMSEGEIKFIKKHNKELYDEQGNFIGLSIEEADKYQAMLKGLGKLKPETKDALVAAWNNVLRVQAQYEQGTERATIKLSEFDKGILDSAEDVLKKYAEYFTKLEALRNKNRESEIAQLEGVDKINAQEKYELESLDKTEQFLIKEYKLNVTSIEEIQRAKELITLIANKKRIELEKQAENELRDINKAAWDDKLNFEKKYAENELELIGGTEEDKINLQIEDNKKRIKELNKSLDPKDWEVGALLLQENEILKKKIEALWDGKSLATKVLHWMGFADDQIQPIIDAAQSVFDSIKQITDQRVEDAERQTDILNQRIEEEQNALETEKDLMEKGFASNVRAKANEIELLKQQRDKALKEEEKARKIQNALDTATQTSNLITASTNIIRTLTWANPLGVILSSIAIGLMFSTFLAAKIQARKAAQLAEGGSGTVKGKRHSEGGEAFLNHVEVEDGEAWGVLSRGATAKYGNEFHQVIKAFNKGDIKKFRAQPNLKPVINISSDLSEKRLSSIEREMKQLNKHFTDNGERTELADRTIIRKNHHTRVIRKR